MEKQMLEINGLQILEPGTFVSDLIMAAACIYFFYALIKVSESKYHKYFSYFFLFMGLSSFIGAFAHGFYMYTGKSLHFIAWLLTGMAIYFIEFGISGNIKNKKKRFFFVISIKAQLIAYIILTTFFMNFLSVKINTAIGLLGIVFPILSYHFFKHGERNYIFVMFGITLAIIPALMHRAKFSIGKIFNMNDLSHFFLILCLFLIFIGLQRNILNEKIISRKIQA